MNKVAHYLQEHLVGEVMTGTDARKYFSTDLSILSMTPSIIVYPRGENDIRKTARFAWQLAERGRMISITSRGSGTDQGGAAIGSGIMLVFPAHMHRVLELDGKSGMVTVEPGVNFGKLQQTLITHNRFLPSYPASYEYSTIGGAVANNASGEKTVKYGDTREYVKALRVVLANGEVVETSRLSRRDLNKKLGLSSLEGEIYRNLDNLIDENHELIKAYGDKSHKNNIGYALDKVRNKDGSFDLTPLLVGSQGTLGIVTEVTLETEQYNPHTTLIMAHIDDVHTAQSIIAELRALPHPPSSIEMVDENLLKYVHTNNPNQLKGSVQTPFKKLILFIEFDNPTDRMQKRMSKRAAKMLDKQNIQYRLETDVQKKDELWKIRHASSAVFAHTEGASRALPIIEDGVVPPNHFAKYVERLYELCARFEITPAIWGHAGEGNIHIYPLLDLSAVGDRQKIFKLMDEYYQLLSELGGSSSGEHNDGRIRAPYLEKFAGSEMYELFEKVKKIFDPYNNLNPGVKLGTSIDDIKPLMRSEYNMKHLHEHMPRS